MLLGRCCCRFDHLAEMDVDDGSAIGGGIGQPQYSQPPPGVGPAAGSGGAGLKRRREDGDGLGDGSGDVHAHSSSSSSASAASSGDAKNYIQNNGKKRGRPPKSAAAEAALAAEAASAAAADEAAVDFNEPYRPGVILHLPQVTDAARRIAAAFGVLKDLDDGDRAEITNLEVAAADIRGRLADAREQAAARPGDDVASSLVRNTEEALVGIEGKLAIKQAIALQRFRRNVRDSLLRVTLQKDVSTINERGATTTGALLAGAGSSSSASSSSSQYGGDGSGTGASSLPPDVLYVQAPKTVCAHCGNADETLFVHEYRSGDVTCAKCGVVAVEHAIFDGDWTRSFEGEESTSQIGPRPDPLMSSSFNLRTGMALSAGVSKAKLRMLREFQDKADMMALGNDFNERRTREGFKDKQKQRSFEKLQDVGERLRIASGVVDRSKVFFAAFRDNREHVTKLEEAIAASLIAAVEEAVYGRLAADARVAAAKAAEKVSGGVDSSSSSAAAAASVAGKAADAATLAAASDALDATMGLGSPTSAAASSSSSSSAADEAGSDAAAAAASRSTAASVAANAPAPSVSSSAPSKTSSAASLSASSAASAAVSRKEAESEEARRLRLKREAERRALEERKRNKLHGVKVLGFLDGEDDDGAKTDVSGAGAGAGAGAGSSSSRGSNTTSSRSSAAGGARGKRPATAMLSLEGGNGDDEQEGEEEEDVSAPKKGFERFSMISPAAAAAAAARNNGGKGAFFPSGGAASSFSSAAAVAQVPTVSDAFVDELYARAAERLETNPDLEERDDYKAPS